MTKNKLDYYKMLTEIDELVNTDFGQDMELKLMPKAEPFTQAEAKKMSEIITRVYSISHCCHCSACQVKYKN